MSKFYDKDGNEVKGFTEEEFKLKEEELEKKGKDFIVNYIKENPDKGDELDKTNKALDEANRKIEEFEEGVRGGSDADRKQKDRLIEEKNKAKQERDEVTESFTKQINDLKDNLVSGAKEKMLKKLSGGDDELRKKIEFEYDDYSKGKELPSNDIEVQERLTKAFVLAAEKPVEPSIMDGITGAGAKGDLNNGGLGKSTEPETSNSKGMRNVLGISDADVEKYGGKNE